MNQPIDLVTQPEIALLRVLVAGLLGALIGTERERASHAQAAPMFAGIRTFPIFAILGCSLTLATGEIGLAVVAGFLAVAGLALAAYWRSSSARELGATTESAGLATYWVGAIAGSGALLLAAAIGITIAVLLASKERLEAFPQTMSREELRATLTLAVIAAVILPLLPDQSYGPWGVWNPRKLWTVVVLVSALSFVAFLAIRFWGNRRGVYLSGLLGGLVSSTAVTVSFAAHSREAPKASMQLALGAGMASVLMLVRIAVLAAVAGPAVLPRLAPFLVAAFLGGTIAIAVLAKRASDQPTGETGLTNPFRLMEAIRFAVVFALVLLAVQAARHFLGGWGIFAASLLAGIVDVDAITLSLSSMSGRGLPPETAAGGIAVAALANTGAKIGYAAWRGTATYRNCVAIVLGATLVAGAIAIVLIGVRS